MATRTENFMFVKDWYVANKDRQVFKAYSDGDITAERGANQIALNNRYPCTVKQFIRLAHSLGYYEKRK